MRHRLMGAAVFVLSCIFFLVVGEFAMSGFLGSGYYIWPPNFQRSFEIDPKIVHGVAPTHQLSISSDGLRGDPLSTDAGHRILAIGGSTTICAYLDDSKAWPYLLQQNLNEALGANAVWVGNGGRPGHSTPSHILQVEKLLAQYPEIDSVVLLVGVNDALVSLEATIDTPMVFDRSPDHDLRMAFSVFPEWDADAPWYTRNVIGRLTRLRSWKPIPLKKDGVFSMDSKGEFYAMLRKYRKAASTYREQLPDLSGPLRKYAANLNKIVDHAHAAGKRVIFLTQPTLWRADLTESELDLLWAGGTDFFHLELGKPFYSAGVLAQTMDRYNQTLLGVCAQRGATCIDLASAIPRSVEMFYDDAHFTEQGSALVASELAKALSQIEPFASLKAAPAN